MRWNAFLPRASAMLVALGIPLAASGQEIPDARDAHGLDLQASEYPVSREERVGLFNGVLTYHRDLIHWPEPGGQALVLSLDYSSAVEHHRFDITSLSARTHATGVFGEWSLCLNGHALWTGNLAPYLHNGEFPGQPYRNESAQIVDGCWRTQGFSGCDRAYSAGSNNGDVALAMAAGGLAEFGYVGNSPVGSNPVMRPVDPASSWRASLETPAHTNRTLKLKKPDGSTSTFAELPLTLSWPGYYFNTNEGPRAFRLAAIAGPTPEFLAGISYQYADSGQNKNAFLHPTYIGIGDGHGRTAEITIDENLGAGTCDVSIHSVFPAPDIQLSFSERRYTDRHGASRHSYLFYLDAMTDRVGNLTRFRYESDERSDAFPNSCADSLDIRARRLTGVDYPAGGSSTYLYSALPATRPPCPSPQYRYEDLAWRATGRSNMVAPMVRRIEVREAAAAGPVTTADLGYTWNQNPVVGAAFESEAYRYTTHLDINGGVPARPAHGRASAASIVAGGSSVDYTFRKLGYIPPTSGGPATQHWQTRLLLSSMELASGETHSASFTYDATPSGGGANHGTFLPATRTLAVSRGGATLSVASIAAQYDTLARVSAVTDPLGVVRATEYYDPPSLQSPWSGSGQYLATLVARETQSSSSGALLAESWYDREPLYGRVLATHVRLDANRAATRSFTYDAAYPLRVARASGPMGEIEDYSYEGEFIPGTLWWAECPGRDRPVRTTLHGDGMGTLSIYRSYDVEGNLRREADGSGHTTHTDTDGNGRPVSIALPGDVMTGPPPSPGFKPMGLPYDQSPWPSTTMTFQEYPGLSWIRYAFYPAMLESLGTTAWLDGLGRKKWEQISLGAGTVRRDYTYDSMGRIAQASGPLGASASYAYDELGRLISAGTPSGGATTFEHTNAASLAGYGLALPFAAPSGGFALEITHHATGGSSLRASNVRGQLVAAAEYAPGAATPAAARYFETDPLGRVLGLYAPDGTCTRFSYDMAADRLGATQPDGTGRTVIFDLEGRPAFLQDERLPAGTSWSYIRYDAISRPLETGTLSGMSATQLQPLADAGALPPGVQWRARYTHDGSGDLNAAGCLTRARVPGPAGGEDTWDFEYDSRKRIVRKTVTLAGAGAPASITSAYDRLDRRTSLTFPDGRTVRFSYEARSGLLSQVTLVSPARTLATFQRDAAGRLSSIAQTGGLGTQWQYNAGGAVLSQLASSMGRTIVADVFEYDASGRMDARTSAGDGRWEFGRDSLARLSSVRFAQEAGAPQLRYHFGASGEVDSISGPLASEHGTLLGPRLRHVTRPPWGAEDRLYDAHGNTTGTIRSVGADTLGRLELRYGDSGELLSVTGRTADLSDSAVYTYDPWLFRSRKTFKGTTTRYLRDENGDLLAELDSAGTMIRGYVRAEGRILGVLEPGGRFVAYATDALGSVRAGVEESGAIRFSQQFLPFGELERFEGEERPRLGFLGGEQDAETGFCYLKARYYDPQEARFLTPDPMRDAGAESYAYGFGDPLTFADPSGLAAEFAGGEIGLDDGLGNVGHFMRYTLPPIVIWGTRFQDTFLLTVAALHAIYGSRADLRFWRDAAEFIPGYHPGTSGVGNAGGAGLGVADLVKQAREMVRARLNLYRTVVPPLAAQSVARFLVVHEGAASLKVALALSRARSLTPAQLQSIRLRAGAVLLAETTLDLGTLVAIQLHPSGRLAALVTAPLWTTAREEVSKLTDDALSRIVPGYAGMSLMDAVFGPLPAMPGP